MEKEITMEELVKMVNESSGEIIIHVELGEERDSDERKESVQPLSMPFLFCMFSPFKKCSFLVKKILLIKQCIDSFLFFFHEFFPFF